MNIFCIIICSEYPCHKHLHHHSINYWSNTRYEQFISIIPTCVFYCFLEYFLIWLCNVGIYWTYQVAQCVPGDIRYDGRQQSPIVRTLRKGLTISITIWQRKVDVRCSIIVLGSPADFQPFLPWSLGVGRGCRTIIASNRIAIINFG